MSTLKMHHAFALTLLSCALACAKSSTPEKSSETHFLASCEDGCGDSLDCVCGVCTETCEVGDSCAHLNAHASCIAGGDSSCMQERSCDVECERDADCSTLGERACEAGRCREPQMSMLDASTGDAEISFPAPASCDVDGLVALLLGGTPVRCPDAMMTDAGTGDGSIEDSDAALPEQVPPDTGLESTRACVARAMEEGRAFLVFSTQVGTDSSYGGGYLGFRDDGEWKVYDLNYDSFGIDMDGTGIGATAEPLWWTPCMDFRVNASCDDGCFVCSTARQDACGCAYSQDDAPTTVRCLEPDLPPCREQSCELEGVCYSPQDFFADTLYHCLCSEETGRHCEANGETWSALGRPCENEGDCNPGHSCRTDFAGSPGVCTRSCGPGCPHDLDCVDVPSTSGGMIDDMCLRTCDPSAGSGVGGDCSEGDTPSSECKTLDGSMKTYCL